MNLLLAAAGILILALAGVGLLRFVWPAIKTAPELARLALGYCAGCWLVTMIFFGAYLAGISFSRWLVLGPVIGLALVGGGSWRRTESAGDSRRYIAAVLPGLLCVLALVLSWSRPVYGYDAVMMWALKAKMMFFSRTWPATMFDPFTTAHTEYPPLIPAAQAYVFFWLGEFDDVAARVVFAAFFAAGAVIVWWLLRQLRVARPWIWVTWWCALPVVMGQVELTYADMPLAVYMMVFYGAVVLWLREPERREWLWLAGLFGGMAFWVKQDALIGVGAGLVALVIVRKLSWRLAVVVGLLAVPWRFFVWVKNLPSDFVLKLADLPAKTAQVVGALYQYGIAGGAYAFFWPVLVLALVIGWRKLRLPEARWLAMGLLIGLVGVFGVYWFSTPDLSALLATSLERVLLGLFVPGLVLVALLWPGGRWAQVGMMVAVVGLGLFESYLHTRTSVELWRKFHGKTVTQQHVWAAGPVLARQIAGALDRYPAGTHVQVLPKRSMLRHRFYYETYPYLIVDSTATNVIQLVNE